MSWTITYYRKLDGKGGAVGKQKVETAGAAEQQADRNVDRGVIEWIARGKLFQRPVGSAIIRPTARPNRRRNRGCSSKDAPKPLSGTAKNPRKLLGWDKATGIRAQRGVSVWGYHLIGAGKDEYEIEHTRRSGAEYFSVSAFRKPGFGHPRWDVIGSYGTLALAKKAAEADAGRNANPGRGVAGLSAALGVGILDAGVPARRPRAVLAARSLTLAQLTAAVKRLGGVKLRRVEGEYRVAFTGRSPADEEVSAYYTMDADDALGTARQMSDAAPPHGAQAAYIAMFPSLCEAMIFEDYVLGAVAGMRGTPRKGTVAYWRWLAAQKQGS